MARKNEHKEVLDGTLKLLKESVALVEEAIKKLSKSQYDKGWHKGRETGRAETTAKRCLS